MSRKQPATIRAAVIDRAAALGLTAYALSKDTADPDGRPAVSEEMLRLYLTGRSDLASRRLDAVFRVLGLAVSGRASPAA